MSIPIALIPVLRPLYRYPVWDKMNKMEGFDLELFSVEDEMLENIAFVPMETIRAEFNHQPVRNIYIPPGLLYQKGVFRGVFSKNKALIYSGNIRSISTWISAILGRLFGKKIYFWSHGAYGNERGMILRMKKWFFRIPHGTFLYGNHARELMLRWGIKAERMHVIYNSLDHDHHLELRKQVGSGDRAKLREHFGNDLPVLLFIGRLTPQKRLSLLFQAVQELEARGDRVNILLIGDGSEIQNLKEEASKLQSQTWFYGKCYKDEELSALIAGADLCVSPGNVGLTAIHCMSFGTPVISHGNMDNQMPESEALTHGKTGLFFEEGSAASLADAIQNWLAYQREAGRDKIRRDCFEIVDSRFNPNYQKNIIKQVLLRDLKINAPERHAD